LIRPTLTRLEEMTVRLTSFALAPLCVLFALGGAARAQSTVDDCLARIDLVQEDLAAVAIGGNNPDQTYQSLAAKLQAAEAKLAEGKAEDALQKLVDFRDAVVALRDAAKPKLSASDAAQLLDGGGEFPNDQGVNGAIACVLDLLP
jgi:hypothetical protein